MSASLKTPLENVADAMHRHGAHHVVFKLLANNDNSKQQIYFGGDFDVLRMIPHGELTGTFSERDGVIFKAPLTLSWLPADLTGLPSPAPGAQLIYYPRYPEVRMSGFLRGCAHAPSHLMQPPTPEERILREHTPRCLVLGICPNGEVLAYVGAWGSVLAQDAILRIQSNRANSVASVFYELRPPKSDGRKELLRRLCSISASGPIASCRLDATGQKIQYSAKNAAGYTLESLFNITPNGASEPDFMGWELKAHSSGALTLMTPEPDSGSYLDDLGIFLENYGRSDSSRRDFTGRHLNNIPCERSSLTLRMEGYDPNSGEVIDPDGGLTLRDEDGNLAAGWSFSKLISHWSRKHAQTAYITYTKTSIKEYPYFQYGPEVLLCRGSEVKRFLSALHDGTIYYDPGVNQKLHGEQWRAKKRNQFRVAWKNVCNLYEHTDKLDLSQSQWILNTINERTAHTARVHENKHRAAFRFIDLFAGIGGMRKAFDAAGGQCVFTSEWNNHARMTYQANYECDHEVAGDITKIEASEIPAHDVLVAGFPCQPFSIAGVSKKNSLGRTHGFEGKTQGSLFFDVARILAYHRPAAFLLENVKNLKGHDKGRTFQTIMETLRDELGYHVHHRIIDAQHWVPQHRERIFIVGFREDVPFDFDQLVFPEKPPVLGDILHPENGDEEAEAPFTVGDAATVAEKYTLTAKLWDYLQAYADKHKAAGNGFGFVINGRDDVTQPLSARYYKDGSEILVHQQGNRPRRLTPRECARLMGFDMPGQPLFEIPVSDTQAYKQFGNAVVVPKVKAIAQLMRPHVEAILAGQQRGQAQPVSEAEKATA